MANILGLLTGVKDTIQEAVVDQDARIRLDNELQKLRTEFLLNGKKSITKIMISALVGLVAGTITFAFLYAIFTGQPEVLDMAKGYALSISPILGMLIGAYGTFRSLGKKWNGNGNNNNNNSNHRSSYRPTKYKPSSYKPAKDKPGRGPDHDR